MVGRAGKNGYKLCTRVECAKWRKQKTVKCVVRYQVDSFPIGLEIENFSEPLVAFKRLLKSQTKELILQCELWINEI